MGGNTPVCSPTLFTAIRAERISWIDHGFQAGRTGKASIVRDDAMRGEVLAHDLWMGLGIPSATPRMIPSIHNLCHRADLSSCGIDCIDTDWVIQIHPSTGWIL